MRNTQSHKIALCGVLGALSVALFLMGNLLQIGTYAAPMLAAFLLIPILEEYGRRYAFMLYLTVSILSVLLVPDLELSLFYLFVVGYYPILRTVLERICLQPVRWIAKFAWFNAAVVIMYLLLIFVLAPPELAAEFAADGAPMLVLLLAMGNLSFWFCDRALVSMTVLYRRRLRSKLKKMF